MPDNKYWVVIPTYNEEKTIRQLILKIKEFSSDIIVVADGSTDNTLNIVNGLNVHVLHHIVNLGKGSALKTGCDYAIMKGANKIIVIDADLQHDPIEIPIFIKELESKDIVFGYRVITKEMPLVFRIGNRMINSITRLLFGINLKDTQCGYRAFTAEAYKKIRWESSDYFMESEMIANVGKSDLTYAEIPIKTIYSDRYKGTTIIDGIKIVINLFWLKFTKKQL